MKLPLTDEFLLKIYNYLEKAMELDNAPHSFQEAAVTDFIWMRKNYDKARRKKQFSHFLSYLKKKGYIKIKQLEAGKAVFLTQKGKEKALKTKLKFLEKDFQSSKLKKRKDGKLLMVIFDIPEDKRDWRNVLRDGLMSLGYTFFQKSVWISPFDVYQKTQQLILECGLDKYCHIFLIEKI